MKVSACKQAISFRLLLLKSSVRFSMKETLAYTANNYGSLASTVFYNLTYLLFLKVIFLKIRTIAGYSFDEILFFTLITQFNFYFCWLVTMRNIEKLSTDVKNGDLDLWMTRPVPLLWFVSFRKIDLGKFVMDSGPSFLLLTGIWLSSHPRSFETEYMAAGLVVLISGLIITHCFIFIVNLLVFWLGDNANLRSLSSEMAFFGDGIPYEGYPELMKAIGWWLIPSIPASALTTSIILGKTTGAIYIYLAIGMAAIMLLLMINIWKLALKNYSSASS